MERKVDLTAPAPPRNYSCLTAAPVASGENEGTLVFLTLLLYSRCGTVSVQRRFYIIKILYNDGISTDMVKLKNHEYWFVLSHFSTRISKIRLEGNFDRDILPNRHSVYISVAFAPHVTLYGSLATGPSGRPTINLAPGRTE